MRKLDESAVRIGDKRFIALRGFVSVMYDLKNGLAKTFGLTRILPTEKTNLPGICKMEN